MNLYVERQIWQILTELAREVSMHSERTHKASQMACEYACKVIEEIHALGETSPTRTEEMAEACEILANLAHYKYHHRHLSVLAGGAVASEGRPTTLTHTR